MSKYRYLTFQDRKEIERRYVAGDRASDIASRIGVHTATIYHELNRGYTGEIDQNQRPAYSAEVAQRNLQENFKRRGRKSTERKEKAI